MNYIAIPGLKGMPVLNLTATPKRHELIINSVCDYFHTTADELFKRRRDHDRIEARHICQYLLKMHTKMSLKAIGVLTGGWDHTTILYAVERVEGLIETNDPVKFDIERIIDRYL